MTTHIGDLIPEDAQYSFDADTSIAHVTIETRATKPGKPVYATIAAKLSVIENGEDKAICAEFLECDGDASQEDINYALQVIETNDFGVN